MQSEGHMQDKVALVTGGLRGLGRAMTLGLAANGYRVAAVGHILNDIADIENMADSLKLRELILPLAADLRKPKDCDEVIGKTLARFGSVDILVNNAGLTFTYIDPPRFRRGTPQNFWQVSDEIVENVIATNFLAAARMARRVAPPMLEAGWGRIINVTTKLDTMNRLGTHPYGASKAALEMATEVWAKDAEGSGLTVNIVNPGAGANTPGMAVEMRDMSADGRAPKLVEPDEMVPPLLYVVSREADKINGYRFDANAWNANLPPAEAAKAASRPAGFVLHPVA
jgi:NAD(P)-dependent dehydrogenase (short-subunit alcohol dehydrogenase family)